MHKSLDEFNCWPDPILTTELAALKYLKNQCLHLKGFDFWLIQTADIGVTWPLEMISLP